MYLHSSVRLHPPLHDCLSDVINILQAYDSDLGFSVPTEPFTPFGWFTHSLNDAGFEDASNLSDQVPWYWGLEEVHRWTLSKFSNEMFYSSSFGPVFHRLHSAFKDELVYVVTARCSPLTLHKTTPSLQLTIAPALQIPITPPNPTLVDF